MKIYPGYTIVDVAGRKSKVTAEKRKSDRMIQLTVLAEDESTTFRCKNVRESSMVNGWHFAEPVLKIEDVLVSDKSECGISMFKQVLYQP